MKHTKKKINSQEAQNSSNSLPVLFPDTAGIDIGSKSHFVAVPSCCDPKPVREFSTFTAEEDVFYASFGCKQKFKLEPEDIFLRI